MSEENNEVVESSVEAAPVVESMSTADLQDLVTSFDDGMDKNQDVKSSGNSPESDDDWSEDISEIVNNIESKDSEDEEEAPEASSEQQDEPSAEEESEKEDEADSEAEVETKDETTDKVGTIEVKTKDGLLELTLDQIREEHPEVLEQIKSGVSGAKEVAKRFSELDVEKKSFYAEKDEIEGYINQFQEATKDGNILGGLTYFAEFANIPPYLLKEQIIAAMRPEIEKRAQMSQDQINNMRLQEENQYLQEKNESDQQKWQEKQAQEAREASQRDLQNQINSIRETHEVTDEEWEEAVAEVDKELPPEVETIPLQAIQDKILSKRGETQTETRISNLVEPVKDRVNDAFISELKTLMQSHPQLTDEDLNVVIKDSLKIQAEKELKKNLEKKSLEKPKKVIKADSDRSLDDLSDLIEDWD